MTRNDVVQAILADRPRQPGTQGEGRAPANIALCKYWGKRDAELNLPRTDSLSLSLGDLGTHTRVRPAGKHDRILLDDHEVAAEQPFAQRIIAFLDLVRPPGMAFEVATRNTVPTAAGVASSASGFAALVKALNALFDWHLTTREKSILARLGSGSACRSLTHGFVHWTAGTRADGMDSFGRPLDCRWPGLQLGLVPVDTAPKAVSSRTAMQRTVETSLLYGNWPQRVEQDLQSLLEAVAATDLERLGQTAEANAMAMHATMLDSRPPVVYWQPGTLQAIHQVRNLRADGIPVYCTIDAGPNVKLIFHADATEHVAAAFPGVTCVAAGETTAH